MYEAFNGSVIDLCLQEKPKSCKLNQTVMVYEFK